MSLGTIENKAQQRFSRTPQWRAWEVPSVRWAGAALALFCVGLATQLTGGPDALWWGLYLTCYLVGGWESAWAGIQALRGRRLDVDLLMIVAAVAAAAIGQVTDGALLIVIFATSGALEDLATRRTEESVRGLLDLAPETAVLIDADGAERRVPAGDVLVNDVALIRPGERISADGTVISGNSHVDQASITGEPLPAPKTLGDNVFAGTLNGSGTLTITVTQDPSSTVVARIVAMVGEAAATKAQTQLFIEKIEQRYSVGVVVATLALFAVPLTFGVDLQSALLRAMTFMIVASPCALVLATMPPLLSAMANAGRHGVLVKSAVGMERLAETTMVALDKTGTLTRGTPRLTEITVLDQTHRETDALRIAAAVEQFSEHPLGKAIVAAARERGLTLPDVHDFRALAGQGVQARVGDAEIKVLSPQAFSGSDLHPLAQMQAGGATAVILTSNNAPVAILGLHDEVRPDAADAVRSLTAHTSRPPALLTGDNARAAAASAQMVGITDVRAELLPHQKAEAVRTLQDSGERVLVIGDGVNDAPAMAGAHTSLAMGRSGSDLALETADAVSVRDELTVIPTVIALARRARRVVIANLVIAASFITVLVIWDLVGHLPLPLGVAGHEGSTILVALNGLRLLTDRAWRQAQRQPA
ncbi:cobalt-translocating P-type ATPase CtpD [soil metagenome]